MKSKQCTLALCLITMAITFCKAAESPDIFVGPFSHWINAKNAPYNAKGDGTTDDRTALQAALSAVQTTGKNAVIYLPAGTYRITNTLTLQNSENVRIVGAHPDSVTIKYDGTNTDMFHFTGCPGLRVGRMLLEGASKGRCGIMVDCNYSSTGNMFPSGNEFHDLRFQNLNTGIQGGQNGTPLPEATVIRCQFKSCVMGINVQDWNTADVWIRHCLFEDCGTGDNNGCGETQVYNCIFKRSTIADVQEGTFGMSVRHCYSINSKKFFLGGGGGDGFTAILDGNTIIDPTGATPIDAQNPGPHMLFDNIIKTPTGSTSATLPIIKLGGSSQGNFLINNTLTAGTEISAIRNSAGSNVNVGRVFDTHIVNPSTITAVETLLPTCPARFTGLIIEPTARTGTAIQAAIIDAATNHPNELSVVYLRMGADYLVSSTIIVPKNIRIWIMGDLFGNSAYPTTGASRLLWNGTGTGPMIKLMGPSKTSISDLSLYGGDKASGILVDNADQQSGRVFMYHVSSGEGLDGIGCLVDSVDWTRVEAWDYRVNAQLSTNLGISTKVIGGPLTAAGQATTGCMNIWGANVHASSGSITNPMLDIANGGRLMLCDNWGEGNPRQPFIKLTSASSGTFTTQGYKMQYHTNGVGTTPTMIYSGFTGKASVLCLTTDNVIVDISGANAGQNVFYAGFDFGYGGTYAGGSTITATQGKAALVNCTYVYQDNIKTTAGHVGAYPKPDQGNSINDTVWMRNMMEQAQNNHPMVDLPPTPDGTTDIKFFRIAPNHTRGTGIQIKGCPTCVPGVLPRSNRSGFTGHTQSFKSFLNNRILLTDKTKIVSVFDVQGRMMYNALMTDKTSYKKVQDDIRSLQMESVSIVRVE